jgi:hypothetical protein
MERRRLQKGTNARLMGKLELGLARVAEVVNMFG